MAKSWTPEEIEETFSEMCDLISDGESLDSLVHQSGFPAKNTFYNWIDHNRLKDPTEQQIRDCNRRLNDYMQARENRADKIFEEILTIADDGSQDTKTLEDGREVVDHEIVQRSRLRIDARKWMLGRMNAKKYGDKIDVTSKGEKINNAPPSQMNISLPDGTNVEDFIDRLKK